MLLQSGILLVASYLLGSINFSYILTKLLKDKDIRDYGSGNAGATNTYRVSGKLLALIVFILDILKGVVAVLFISDVELAMLSGLTVIIGHNWPIFLKFKGGKGIATTIGVTAILMFKSFLVAGIVGILVVVLTRFVSLGSLIFTGLLPIVAFIFGMGFEFSLWALSLFLLAALRHKQNIYNLINGVERKV